MGLFACQKRVDYGGYDNDGYADATVIGETGGACCGGQLFLVSHRGNRHALHRRVSFLCKLEPLFRAKRKK